MSYTKDNDPEVQHLNAGIEQADNALKLVEEAISQSEVSGSWVGVCVRVCVCVCVVRWVCIGPFKGGGGKSAGVPGLALLLVLSHVLKCC